MTNFERAYRFVVGAEGGFTNDPNDRGNWTSGIIGEGELKGTNKGISAMSYPNRDIEKLTDAEIAKIYESDYWHPMRCDYVSYPKGLVMFDCAVNQGRNRAARFAQSASGAVVDGIMGRNTIMAMQLTTDEIFVEKFLSLREDHYRRLSTFERYGKGWLRRIEHVRKEALNES